MANEFKHKDPGTELTQAEFIASDGTGHIFDSQATGDIMYASSATVLKNLGKGAANTVLSMGGSCIPAWTASPSVTDLTIGGGCITLSAATDIDLLDNNASALSFDSTGKAGIIDIVTTNCSEGVTMSGTLGVTGVLTSTGGITVGVCDTGLDVKFFGASAGAYMLYDQSCDQLEIRGAAADAATSTGKLLLSTALTNINANDVIGSINFQAPLEAGDCDSRLVAAGIRAVAQATFTCAVNATDLIFYTGHSEAAAERFRFTSQGEIGIAGANYGSDGQVLTSTGCGTAVAWECAGGGGRCVAGDTDNGIITWVTSDNTFAAEANLTFDGTTLQLNQASCRQILGPDGAVSKPGFSFACDPDSGMWRSGANIIRWNAGNACLGLGLRTCGEFTVGNAPGTFSGEMIHGLKICQGTQDDFIISLKSCDTTHGVTGLAETDTFAFIKKAGGNDSGLNITGFSESNGGIFLQAISPTDVTTKTAGCGISRFSIKVSKSCSTGTIAPGTDANLVDIRSEGNIRFIFDQEGTAHADVGVATYDDYCDIELMRGMLAETVPCYRENFGKDMMYNLCHYTDMKLIGKDSVHWEQRDCGKWQQRAMVNFTGLTMLHHSTIIQMHDNLQTIIQSQEQRISQLESQLALGGK